MTDNATSLLTAPSNHDASPTRGGSSLDAMPCSPLPVVLDACCGPRMMWFDSQDDRTLYVDKRCGTYPVTRKSRPNAKATEVNPDMLVDFTEMPFPDASFIHVVFDPPHLSKIGDTSTTAKNYGKLMHGWEDVIAKGFSECFRVLKPGGTLIFKWCEFEIPLRDILALTPQKPLYGHRTGARQKTHWVAFVKSGEVTEMRLCESSMVMLRPNQEYRFTVDPNCEKCAAAAKPYQENVQLSGGRK